MNLNKYCGAKTPNIEQSANHAQAQAQNTQNTQNSGGFCANQNLNLSDFDALIFDLDGVITTENAYWLCAAKTVQTLILPNSLSVIRALCSGEISENGENGENGENSENSENSEISEIGEIESAETVYNTVMCDGKTVLEVKNKGVNTNYDLTYIVLACALKTARKVGEVDKVGEVGKVDEIGKSGEIGKVGKIVKSGEIGEVDGIGKSGEIGKIGKVGEVDEVGENIDKAENQENSPRGVHCTCAAAFKSGRFLIDFNKTLEEIKSFPQDTFKIYDICAEYLSHTLEIPKKSVLRGNSLLYDIILDIFQYYFLGFDGISKHYKAKTNAIELLSLPKDWEGFVLSDKKTAVPTKVLKKTLKALKDRGLRLGIGTGRPRIEAILPLSGYGILDFFDPDMICTLSDVETAENAQRSKALENSTSAESSKTSENSETSESPESVETSESVKGVKVLKNAKISEAQPLSKPHPYVFLRALFGDETSDADILSGNYDHHRTSRALAVGDAAADLIAAKRGGLSFLGVLTGVDKESAKEVFLSGGADFILNDISEISKFL